MGDVDPGPKMGWWDHPVLVVQVGDLEPQFLNLVYESFNVLASVVSCHGAIKAPKPELDNLDPNI